MEEKRLLKLLTKMEIVEFIGIAKLLGIPLIENNTPIEFADVLDNVLKKFSTLNQKRKKEILDLVEKSIKKRGNKNAHNS